MVSPDLRYSYVLNNPLIYVDPTGHFSITDFAFGCVHTVEAASSVILAATLPVGIMIFVPGAAPALPGVILTYSFPMLWAGYVQGKIAWHDFINAFTDDHEDSNRVKDGNNQKNESPEILKSDITEPGGFSQNASNIESNAWGANLTEGFDMSGDLT